MNDNYKLIYKYKKDKQIELKVEDLKVLLFLYDQSLLSQPQLFSYYQLVSDFKSDSAFRRKVSKWNEAGIIRKIKRNKIIGYQLAIVQLTEAGLRILVELGLVPNDVNLKYAAKSNLDHTLAIKEVLISWLKSCNVAGHSYYVSENHKLVVPIDTELKFEHLIAKDIFIKNEGLSTNYYNHYMKIELINNAAIKVIDNNKLLSYGLKPDLILSYDNDIVYYEIDTGSESLGSYDSKNVNTIKGKINRYNEYKSENLNVIFLVLDEYQSFKTIREYTNRSRRVFNIKDAVSDMVLDSHLNMFVLPFSRIESNIKLFMKKGFALNLLDEIFLDVVRDALSKKSKNEWKILREAQEFIQADVRVYNFGDKLPEAIFQNKEGKLVIPLYLKEGNINDYRLLIHYLEKLNKGDFMLSTDFLLVYYDEVMLTSDVLPRNKLEHYFFFHNQIIKCPLVSICKKNYDFFNMDNIQIMIS